MDIIRAEIQRRGLWTPWLRNPNEVGKLPLARWLYKTLAFAEQSRWEGYLQDRITARGWNSAGFLPRLRALPRSIPQGHRWFLFRYHFNGNMTTTRLAAAGVGSGVEKCIFCGAPPFLSAARRSSGVRGGCGTHAHDRMGRECTLLTTKDGAPSHNDPGDGSFLHAAAVVLAAAFRITFAVRIK